MRKAFWAAAAMLAAAPVAIALMSPLLAGRDAIWGIGGMSGVIALSLLFLQPLFATGALTRFRILPGRRWHQWGAAALLLTVLVHVGGLYLYSPDDITDALLLTAPTPFSVYGVIGLWSLVLTGVLALLRHRLGLSTSLWRIVHSALGLVIVASAAWHAVLIEGAMGETSKLLIAIAAMATTTLVAAEITILAPLRLRKRQRI